MTKITLTKDTKIKLLLAIKAGIIDMKDFPELKRSASVPLSSIPVILLKEIKTIIQTGSVSESSDIGIDATKLSEATILELTNSLYSINKLAKWKKK